MSNSPSASPTAHALPAELPIAPLAGPIDWTVAVPGSKSITNRYLAMAALADGTVHLTGVLHSDDTVFMVEALRALGFAVTADWAKKTCVVEGRGGAIPNRAAELFVGNAGTATRFLAAFVSLGHGRYRLDGVARMRERPIADLLQGLQGLGVDARSEFGNGCPPVIVNASGLPGGLAKIDGSRSSQYISAVLQIAPYAREPLRVEVTGQFVSRPYVELTLRGMAEFGCPTEQIGERTFAPRHGARYRAGSYAVEGDASTASYFLAAAAILSGRCCVTNVAADSAQGDAAFAGVLEKMGCRVRTRTQTDGRGIEVSRDPNTRLRGIDIDMNNMPDVALTLAVVCLFADGSSRIRNVGNLRIKETDRLAALASELRRLGAQAEAGSDDLTIVPGPKQAARIETYDDHRMAMAFALAGLGCPGVTILQPACVAKSYPQFFADLETLRKG